MLRITLLCCLCHPEDFSLKGSLFLLLFERKKGGNEILRRLRNDVIVTLTVILNEVKDLIFKFYKNYYTSGEKLIKI